MKNLVNKIDSKILLAQDLKIHPLIPRLGLGKEDMGKALQSFIKQSATLGYHDRVCVDNSMKVISNPEVVLAAQANNEKEYIEVDVLDIHEDDLIQFINAKNVFRKRSMISKWKYLRELRNYLKTNERGIAWNERLNYGDINQTIAELTDYGTSHIKRLRVVGKYADEHPTENVWGKFQEDHEEDDSEKISFLDLYNKIQNKATITKAVKKSELDLPAVEETAHENSATVEGTRIEENEQSDEDATEASDEARKEAELQEAREMLNAADYFKNYVKKVDEGKAIALFKAMKNFLPPELQTRFVSEFRNITGTIRTVFNLDEETIQVERIGYKDKIVDSEDFLFKHSNEPHNEEA